MLLRIAGAVAFALASLCVSPVAAAEEKPAPTRQCAALVTPAGPDRVCLAEATFYADVCAAIERLGAEYSLPEGYFARLIWQESRFNPSAISPAGAQGIAQFMPGTARLRGLGDAFAPAEALIRSAEYLRFLTDKFGNLGLAAAAYNGGENRVAGWKSGNGWLASETRNYVQIVTGIPVETWLEGEVTSPDFALQPDTPFAKACVDMASARPMPRLSAPSGSWKPWGVLIAQAFSARNAMNMFERERKRFAKVFAGEEPLSISVLNPNFGRRIRHSVQLGRDTRKAAEALCAQLLKAGGSCVVVKN